MWIRSLRWEDPLEEGMQPPVLLPGESQGQRRLVGCSPWGCKELDMTKATEHLCKDHLSMWDHILRCGGLGLPKYLGGRTQFNS